MGISCPFPGFTLDGFLQILQLCYGLSIEVIALPGLSQLEILIRPPAQYSVSQARHL